MYYTFVLGLYTTVFYYIPNRFLLKLLHRTFYYVAKFYIIFFGPLFLCNVCYIGFMPQQVNEANA